MFIKYFWITNTPIGYKKIFGLFIILLFLILIDYFFSSPILIQLTIIIYVIATTIFVSLGLKNGITIVQKRFKVRGITHLVKDHIFPLRKNQPFRGIYETSSDGISASLYLKPNNEWAYFDCIRQIIKQNQPKNNLALVLGGGGAVIPLGLLEHFHIASDVIELSPLMIGIAK